MRAKEFTKEEPRIKFADGHIKFSDHFEDRLLERQISKKEVIQLLHKLEVTRSVDLIKMPFVAFVVKSHDLSLAIYKQLDSHRNPLYVVATAHRTLKAGEDEDVIYLEESTGNQSAAGIVLVAEDTGRYGLQQRSNTINDPGLWAAWGGGRDKGESLEECAIRELKEESGYTGPIKLKRIGENSKYVTFLGVIPHEFEPVPCDEWQDYCWVEAGAWPSPMHPGTAAALKNISLNENFADGKNPGRKGLAKRVGVNCKQPVSKLRSIAAHSSGEKQRMAHWCANMKSGKEKANEEYYDGHNFYGAQIGEADINNSMRAKDFISKNDLDEYTDPELAKTLAYAGVHYPNYKKKPEAFMKWASRAIIHSEEQDTLHNSQFQELHHEIDNLKQLVAKISQRSQ